jgi:TolB-like protein
MRLFTTLLATLMTLAATAAPASAATDRRIAVLYFENTGNPELEMLKLGLSEMLISDLTGKPGVEVVERGRINEILGELDLQKTDKVDQSTAVQLGRLLGVERIVIGSYFELMGQFQLMGRVVDVETGVIVGASQHNGAVADFMTLEDQLAKGLLPFLSDVKQEQPTEIIRGSSPEPVVVHQDGTPDRSRGVGDGGPMAESVVENAAPPDPLGAALAFSEGLDYLDRKDLTRARDAMRRAIELDPSLGAAQDELAKINI